VIVECRAIDSKPIAQAITGRIVERQTAFVHASPRRLAADQDAHVHRQPHDGPGIMGEVPGAGAASPNFGQKIIEVRWRNPGSADSDDAAHSFRFDRARCSGMIPPT